MTTTGRPRKPARARIGATTGEELAAWSMAFETGYDMLGEIEVDGEHPYWAAPIPPDVFRARWREMGGAFLARRAPSPNTPYALTAFGEP